VGLRSALSAWYIFDCKDVRHFSWFLDAIKDSIVKITADLERLKNNPPKLTKPQERTDEISH
ncbi:MAG: hypothetical protein J4F29_21925, partial [Candidatus Latescibacteria bacterium]|nr:hypothetical protein [Candidatus Latescibacterota bacterium]